jgi:hypothetical protein
MRNAALFITVVVLLAAGPGSVVAARPPSADAPRHRIQPRGEGAANRGGWRSWLGELWPSAGMPGSDDGEFTCPVSAADGDRQPRTFAVGAKLASALPLSLTAAATI